MIRSKTAFGAAIAMSVAPVQKARGQGNNIADAARAGDA